MRCEFVLACINLCQSVCVCVCEREYVSVSVTGNDTKREAEELRQAQAHQIVPTTPPPQLTLKTTIHFYDEFYKKSSENDQE